MNSNCQGHEINETALKAASIVTKVVGFPYKAKSYHGETTAWRIFPDENLFERKMEERYGPSYDRFAITDDERYRGMQKEIGMDLDLSRSIDEIRCEKSGLVTFGSTIMVDMWWSVESDGFHLPREKVPELDDPKNWPKWKRKMPVMITMLSKCHEMAKKASEEFGVKVSVKRLEDSDDYVFQASFDSSGMSEEKFLQEVERHCRAMVEAYKGYEPWLKVSEHEKLVRKAKEDNTTK